MADSFDLGFDMKKKNNHAQYRLRKNHYKTKGGVMKVTDEEYNHLNHEGNGKIECPYCLHERISRLERIVKKSFSQPSLISEELKDL